MKYGKILCCLSLSKKFGHEVLKHALEMKFKF